MHLLAHTLNNHIGMCSCTISNILYIVSYDNKLRSAGMKPSDKLEETCAVSAESSIGGTTNASSLKALQSDLLQNKLSQFLPNRPRSVVVNQKKLLPLPSVTGPESLSMPDPLQISSMPQVFPKSLQPLIEVWMRVNEFFENSIIYVLHNASPEYALPLSKLFEQYKQYPIKLVCHVAVEKVDKSQCKALSAYKSSGAKAHRFTTYCKFEDDQATFNAIMLALWHARQWKQIMSMIAADHSDQGLVLNSVTFLISALVDSQHSFHPIQQQAYKFLAGVSAMIQNNPVQAQSLISQAYFGQLPPSMGKEALSILTMVTTKVSGCLNLYDELKAATLQGIINHENQNPNSKLLALLPTDEELCPPNQVSSRLSGMLKSRDFNCLIKEKEEKILDIAGEGTHNEEQVGNFYLDLMQSCRVHQLELQMRSKAHSLTYEERLALNQDCNKFGINTNAMRGGCLIVAALWFLKKLQRVTNSKRKAYTLKKKIHKCLEDAFTLVQSKHMDPGMKVYVSRMCAGAKLASIRCTDNTTVDDLNFMLRLFQSLNETSCLTPFWSVPSVSVYETTLLSYNLGRLHSGFILYLQNLSPEAHTVSHTQLLHQLYENDFTSLLPLQNPEQVLTEASEMFLREKDQTLDDVAQLLHSPFTPSDIDGWPNHFSNSRHESMQYASIDGFIVNSHADAVTIDVKCQSVDKGKGIFSENDLRLSLAVLASVDNPMNLTFSLDPPSGEQYPLFQELRFDPLLLEDTPIVQVMLEVDYLLKQLTTGSEISCKPPFHQRPTNEGLTKHLPPHLRKGLQPPKPNSRFDSHRFWIKAEQMDYEILDDNTIKIGKVEMVVHHHPQKQCADGRRCDTEQEDPNSSESKFASFFTEHFDELAIYYPVLARLTELCKIQLIAKIVKEKMHSIVKSTADGMQKLSSFSVGKMGLALVSIIPTFAAYRKCVQSPSKTRKQKRKSRSHSVKYVPSTFFRGRNQRCTGGVVLQPKLGSKISQQHRTYVCGKCCSTAPTSSMQATKSVDEILHESANQDLSQMHQSHLSMPQNKFVATKSVDQILHEDSYLVMNEMQKSGSTATRSVDQVLHDDELKQTVILECDRRRELAAALSADNAAVSVHARAAAVSKNSKASASKPVRSQNTCRATMGVDQIVHDQTYFAQRQNPNHQCARSRDYATRSVDQVIHNNPSYHNRIHEAKHKGDSFQATKSVDQVLHDDQVNPVCKICLCPIDPSTSATSSVYPKGVKLAPMINCKQISVATSTSLLLFEGCTSVYLKLGSNSPSIEQLKLYQPVQTIPWKSTDSGSMQAPSLKNLQPLTESSPCFTVNTDKWKHLTKFNIMAN